MTIRIGVFGAGYWGRLAEAAARWLPEVTVDRVWSRSAPRAEELAAKLGCRVAGSRGDVADPDHGVKRRAPVADLGKGREEGGDVSDRIVR